MRQGKTPFFVLDSLTSAFVTSEYDWLWWTLGGGALVLAFVAWWVWKKGQPFMAGDVFRASRLSRGNRLFPTQVGITPTSVVQYQPRWIGKQEEVIHMAHIASVKIDTGALLSNVLIESSGGTDPILCHGHTKGDAVRMKALIERYQTDQFQARGKP
jgi:hypothetical protein